MTGHPPYDPPVSERMEEPRDPLGDPLRGPSGGQLGGHGAEPDPWRDAPRWSEAASDPWAGSPAWSDGSAEPATAATMAPATAAETTADPHTTGPTGATGAAGAADVGDDAPDGASGATPTSCSWCGTRAAPAARTCATCGAALAQRESIGELVIPGLTAVDPALKDFANRPLHLAGPSPSQGVASGAIAAAAMGGPMGIAVLGGVAAMAAAEYAGANRTGAGGRPVEQVGQASSAALQAIDRLERGEALPTAHDTTPRPELEATDASGALPATQEETADAGD
jgi:hypothetical protein